jgi:opacity protein-like surface antigen
MQHSIIAAAILTLIASHAASAADLGGDKTSVEKTRLRGGAKDVHAGVAAEPQSSFYSAWRGGLSHLEDTNVGLRGTLHVDTTYQQGLAVSSATGMTFDRLGLRGLRGEIETGLARQYVGTHTQQGTVATLGNSFGRTGLGYITANLAYDFDTGSKLKPYVMAGGGYGIANFRDHGVSSLGSATLSSNDGGYVYQVGAGASYYVGAGVRMELGYRYLAMPGVELVAVDGTRSSTKIADHQVLFGLRKGW